MNSSEIFDAIDVDKTGFLSYDMVILVFKSFEIGVCYKDLKNELIKIDAIRKGSINKSDFDKLCKIYFCSQPKLKNSLLVELESLIPDVLNRESLTEILSEHLLPSDIQLFLDDLESTNSLSKEGFLLKIKEYF